MAGRNRRDPLHVGVMAVALIVAAFTGAALGLVWQTTGLGKEAPADVLDELAANETGQAD